MKKQKGLNTWIATLLITMTMSLFTQATAQTQGVGKYRTDAITAMEQRDWGTALVSVSTAIEKFDKRAVTLYGGKFGWFWYHKGYCELKLKKYDDAVTSFETCYTKYPSNAKMVAGKMQGSDNYFHKLSLIKWGDALKESGNYAGAVEKYKQFLAEKTPKEKYDRGILEINLSYCHSKIKKLSIAKTHLENAIKVKNNTKSPSNKAIMTAFYVLAEGAIAAKDDKVISEFLKDNRANIALNPMRMNDFVPLLMKLAASAYQADMKEISIQLYGLIPGSLQLKDDMEAYLTALGPYDRSINEANGAVFKKEIVDDLNKVNDRYKKDNGPEVITMAANAFIHETTGNVRGAYAAYRQLEHFYPKRAKRELELYQLVRTSSLMGDVLETLKYGQLFLKDFPTSEHAGAVKNVTLSSLFQDSKYESCIEVAEQLLPQLEPGSKEHDICLHVLSGSYYYTGDYNKANPLLKEHLDTYGDKSVYKVASSYFYGANLSRLQEWKKAGKALDDFLKKYPTSAGNPYLAFATYDRANCHYSEEEMEQALKQLAIIEEKFPTSPIADAAFNLTGNILQGEDELGKAEEYYKKGHELAKSRGNTGIAGESLYYLIALLGAEKMGAKENTRIKEAVPYYDLYWKEYSANSPYKAQVAVAGVLPMTKAGRADEALDRLQGVIAGMAKTPGARGLEEAINSYTEAYLVDHSPDELKDHYYAFPGIDADDQATLALLRIAIIGVFEKELGVAQKEKDQARVDKAEASIKVIFQKLDTDFNPKDLSNYILVRVGDYLRLKTASPRKALKYYDEILGREDQSHRFAAIFGAAEILAESTNVADQDKAIKQLEGVYTGSEDKSEKEKSLYRIVTTQAKKEDWAKVEERAREYKKKENRYTKFMPEVSFLLAQSFDKRKMDADAHREYMGFRGAYYGLIKYSAPSTKRIMEILWKRNKPVGPKQAKSDRQFAYEDGWNFIDATERIVPKMSDEEIKLRDEVKKLVQQYEAGGQITDMATLKKQELEKKGR